MARVPKIFLGSASETKLIVDDLSEALAGKKTSTGQPLVEPLPWTAPRAFKAGEFTLESLNRNVEESDFAAFIVGRSDVTVSRGKETRSPRDNVIFEAGLFTSRVGLERTFYLVDRDGTKIPSDWAGVNYLTFNTEATTSEDRVGAAADGIADQIETEWTRYCEEGRGRIIGDWWQFVTRNADRGRAAISLFSISEEQNELVITGRALDKLGRKFAQFRSRATKFDERTGILSYLWAGEHHLSGQQMSGIGEVRFGSPTDRGIMAVGQYSVAETPEPGKTYVKYMLYERADAGDAELIRNADGSTRHETLINRLLKQLEEIQSG